MVSRDQYVDLADGTFNLTTSDDLRRLFETVELSPQKDRLVVHFHGGLVSRASAEESAAGLIPYYEAAGAYPIFFFWHSDLQTTFLRNLDQIAKEPAFKRLVKRLVQLAVAKLLPHIGGRPGGLLVIPDEDALPDDLAEIARYANAYEPDRSRTGGAALTQTQRDQAETALEQDDVIQSESRAIVVAAAPPPAGATVRARGAAGEPVVPRTTLMSRPIVDELVQEHPGAGERVGILTFVTLAVKGALALKRVVDRFGGHRDHRLYTTVVEELLRELYVDSIGAVAWALMKQDTAQAFGRDPRVHGGTAFLEQLRAWWRLGRRICLVGHSTGAIYIGHLLEHADGLDPRMKFDVVFLAPACSFAFLAERLPAFKQRVERIRTFGLTDELERGYWEVPAIYPASLLYLVSGLFEEPTVDMPIVGMQRYFSGADPYGSPEIRAVTDYLQGHCVWALADAGVGLRSAASTHSAFNKDVATLESVRDFVQGH